MQVDASESTTWATSVPSVLITEVMDVGHCGFGCRSAIFSKRKFTIIYMLHTHARVFTLQCNKYQMVDIVVTIESPFGIQNIRFLISNVWM